MARWRLKDHAEVRSHYLTLRRYKGAEEKITVAQFYSEKRGAGYFKTVTLDYWDLYNFPDALDFLIDNLVEWRQEIRRMKAGRRRGGPSEPLEEVAK